MSDQACMIEGCDKHCHPRDRVCSMHRGRLQRTGTYERRTVAEKFWAKVNKDGPGGCWLWTGYLHAAGYGRTHIGGRTSLAHRFAYELSLGPIPDGLPLDHLCRVPTCVNPAHLEPVTTGENNRRAWPMRRRNAGIPEPICGTIGGYNAHRWVDQDPCDDCRRARRDHSRTQRAEAKAVAVPLCGASREEVEAE